jgi:hypothetical protein
LDDNDLTETVLNKYVQRLEHLNSLGPFQSAVSKLGHRAFSIYAEAARTRVLNEKELFDLASLISQLDAKRLDLGEVTELADDNQVAGSIRVAAAGLLGAAPSEAIRDLIDLALLSDNYLLRWPALDALKCAPDIEQRLVGYLHRCDLSEKTKLDILDHLHKPLPDKEVRLRFALSQVQNFTLEASYRHRLRVIGASLGDEVTMHALVAEFDSLPTDVVQATIWLFGLHRSRDLGATAVDKMRARSWRGFEMAGISSALSIGATNAAEMISFHTAALSPRAPHPAFDLFLALIDEWRRHPNLEVRDRLLIEIAASRTGIMGATAALHALVTRIVREFDIGDYENSLNDPIRGALDELRMKRHLLELPVAIHLAENSSSNAWIGALYMIAAHGSREAFDYLLARYSAGDGDRSIILDGIEQLSTRLGLTVFREGGALRIGAESALKG